MLRAEALASDPSEQVRAALATSVGDLAPVLGREATMDRVLAILLTLLRDSSSEVRLNVISRLEPVHAVVGVDLLSQSLLPAIVRFLYDEKTLKRSSLRTTRNGASAAQSSSTYRERSVLRG